MEALVEEVAMAIESAGEDACTASQSAGCGLSVAVDGTVPHRQCWKPAAIAARASCRIIVHAGGDGHGGDGDGDDGAGDGDGDCVW